LLKSSKSKKYLILKIAIFVYSIFLEGRLKLGREIKYKETLIVKPGLRVEG
jgi:hypothetical protein